MPPLAAKTIQPPCGRGNASPFGALRHHLSPASGGTITRAYCRAIYEESVSQCFILPPLAGEVRRSRKGGGERSEPISRIVILPYDTESKSRNVLASPLGEEGHEVAKGCTRVRMIMTLDMDVTAERRNYNTHCPIGRYRNLQPKRPSNLRTLRPERAGQS